MPSMRALNVGLAVLWLPASLLMLAGPIFMAWGRWGTVLESHPLTMLAAVAVLVVGFVGLLWAIGTLFVTPEKPLRRTFGRRMALSFSIVLLVLGLLMSAALAWDRPVPAEPRAVAALSSTASVRVVERLTWYELVPTDATVQKARPTPTHTPSATPSTPAQPPPDPGFPVGLVFSPGARIDARAYAAMLRPLAEAGIVVIVLKEPFGLALLPDAQVSSVFTTHPRVTSWVVAGHSMGGVEAAKLINMHPEFSGLLLWAAYPGWPVKRHVPVLSISGSADRLTTPADIEQSKSDLPPDAKYVEVKGANHSAFGDFGTMSGDGAVEGDRAKVQASIVRLSQAFVLAQRRS